MTPAWEALYNARIICGSNSAFILAMMWAGLPFLAWSVSTADPFQQRGMQRERRLQQVFEATRLSQGRELLKKTVRTSRPIAASQVSRPEVVCTVSRCGRGSSRCRDGCNCGRRPSRRRTRTHFGMRLESHHDPIHHMSAGFFQVVRQFDIGFFVKTVLATR